MSLKKMMNSKGPRIEPWGMPERMSKESDRLVPMCTHWDLPVK